MLSNTIRGTNTIKTAVDTVSKVIYALKSFSHFDGESKKIKTDIINNIEMVLTLYHNKMKHNIELIRNYKEVPEIYCFPDELNQVWTNLIQNSLQAMDYSGTLEISIEILEHYIKISISDSGDGIPENIKEQLIVELYSK